jgi:hypothetical protein
LYVKSLELFSTYIFGASPKRKDKKKKATFPCRGWRMVKEGGKKNNTGHYFFFFLFLKTQEEKRNV